ncbi:MAG: 3-deoxy-manno-octulosonate cytidylyltransferase [Planctomycetaceae bacterium]|nr:3-deoxy-manno-octulosonate cytidylyltransferase [Planctomycetaceae bacterium]
MAVVGIIPARLASTRLPGKLLLQETGKPLIQHTWEAAIACSTLDDVLIATDSLEIAGAAEDFGARVVMTGDCANGTERAAQALQNFPGHCDIVVNIQGDEPEIDPRSIELCVGSLQANSDCEMATLANPISSYEQLISPACVKVVLAANGRALYFSRAPIPHSRDISANDWLAAPSQYQATPWLQHIGLYAYRREFLQVFVQLPPAPLEIIEQLEQLRALQAGAGIHVTVVTHRSAGIDTPEDYREFVERFRKTASGATN